LLRPELQTTSKTENGSRIPENLLTLFFADFAITEIFPLFNVKKLIIKS